MSIRIGSEQVTSYSPENDGDIQLIGYGSLTANGAAAGTTIVDADGVGNSGSAATYAGRYWVRILSGTAQGRWKRVTVDNGSGTLTLEGNGFPSQIVSGVSYALYKSGESIVVVDSSSGETNMVDAIRDEADDYWIDYELVPLIGTHAGKNTTVSDFTSSTGTYVLDAEFGGALAAADVCLLRKFIEAGNFAATPDESYDPRIIGRVNLSKGDGVIGGRSGAIAFDIQAKASGTLAADTVIANASEVSGLLLACGLTEVVGTTTKIDDAGAASTTSSLKIDTATHENFQIGQAIMHSGNVSIVVSKTDGGGSADTLGVYPPLPTVPNDNDIVYACRTYKIDTDAKPTPVTVYHEMDGIRHTYFGCVGNVEVVPADSGAFIFRFNFTFVHYVREIEDEQSNPTAAYSTAAILRGQDRLLHLSHVANSSTAQQDAKGLTFTPGTLTSPRDVSGRFGVNGLASIQVTGVNPGGTFSDFIGDDDDADLTAEDIWQTRTAKDVLAVYGSHGDCIAIRMPNARLSSAPHPNADDNKMMQPFVFEAQDGGTVSDPANGAEKLYDWALHIF